jgi:alkylhydroperoxidase family enzyme
LGLKQAGKALAIYVGLEFVIAFGLFQNFAEAMLDCIEYTINFLTDRQMGVPAHTGIAKAMGVSDDITNALRNETRLADGKLEALRTFTLAVVRKRGAVSSDEVQTFIDAGYTQRQVLEIILVLSQKIMSNYINNIAETPVDEPFKKFDWTKNQ